MFEIWTREQCTASVRRDLAQTFPAAKIITVHGPGVYTYSFVDTAGTHRTTVDPYYEADLELGSGDPESVEFGEDDGKPTWFTPC